MLSSLAAVKFLVAAHTCFLMAGPTCAAPRAGAQYDQKLVGLMDFEGRKLTPAQYSRIEIAGHGCFLMSDLNKTDPYLCGDDRHLFNAEGREINVPVPQGTKFRQILWFGKYADEHPHDLISTLPKDALIIFSSNNRLGISDVNRKVLVEPKFSCIGPFSDGAVLLSQQPQVPDAPLVNPPAMMPDEPPPNLLADHLFNTNTQTLKELPPNIVCDLSLCFFSDGLMQCSVATDAALGFVDKNGRMIISPRFKKTGPFVNGRAAVQLLDGTAAIIDKTGKIVSPDDLNVQQFRGKYAIACESSTKLFGLVDRHFKFVIEPKYKSLSEYLPWKQEHSPIGESTDPAKFYIAQNEENNTQILSPEGKVLSTFPAGSQTVGGYHGQLLIQRLGSGRMGKSKAEFWDSHGNKLSKFPDLPKLSDATVQVLTEDRLTFKLKDSRVPFDPKYWKDNSFGSVSRLEMFNRFLKQYNLIGMDVEDVLRLLGYGQRSVPAGYHGAFRSIEYHLIPGGCTDPGTFAKLSFDYGKVSHWCFARTRSESTLIDSNVIIDIQASESHRIGQQNYPVTQPK